ncbi:MAG: two-component system response regulator [Bacteroidetes bacterium GWF2_42_66]|nr:MAG: two-component system response regulator [Bacteroidetes bacterium GWA2_42_15]OFY02723.1 MAG: two-component system response regulator [Bacteroidetes bacterium GWE2_42_39]OFY43922.1 MAG: two-component system response regulator [Bacteroidetes bacterium GWF2_42_66]HBL77554.1 two-component system response regulator [Prolixibacteraceae bacterium]HCR89987.1 two-component system response regulator [Prolixibacteraceae bacterium]
MNTKLKCLLLDDELPGLKYLKMLCEQIPELEVIKAFDNAETFLKELPLLEFDLCFLDIEMPGMDGLSIANLLNGKPVVFTTAYKEYAAEAFDLDAVDYVRKPVTKERLQIAVNKVQERLWQIRTAKNFIQLNTDKGKTLLFFDQVAYIATSVTDSRDKNALLHDGKKLVLKNVSFDRLIQYLPVNEFCQVNKKEVIALRSVQFFSHDEITTNILQISGKPLVLSLGNAYRDDFLKKVQL